MKRAVLTPFIFFFAAAFVLMSMAVVRADMKGDQHQRNIEEKIERLENRIQQLKEDPGSEDVSLRRRLSVNFEDLKAEAGIRLTGLRDNTEGFWTGIEEGIVDFLGDAKKFYQAVRKEHFRIRAEMELEEMVEEKEEFKNDISADSLVRQKFEIFDEKVRKTKNKLRELETAGTHDWQEARDEAELALMETQIIYRQLN